jgi:type II secretory pathway component PulL
MTRFADRNDPVRLFFRRLGLLALLTLVLLVAAEVWDVYQKERESRALRREAEVQLRDLGSEEKHLQAEIASLQTARGKEATLREHYELGKAGEGLIIIVEPPAAVQTEATSTIMQWVHTFLPFW